MTGFETKAPELKHGRTGGKTKCSHEESLSLNVLFESELQYENEQGSGDCWELLHKTQTHPYAYHKPETIDLPTTISTAIITL